MLNHDGKRQGQNISFICSLHGEQAIRFLLGDGIILDCGCSWFLYDRVLRPGVKPLDRRESWKTAKAR